MENKNRRINKQTLMNTEHLKIEGPPKPFFVSEVLTSKNKKLFFDARNHVKNKKLHAAWTSFGKIYVKRHEGSDPVQVLDESALLSIAK